MSGLATNRGNSLRQRKDARSGDEGVGSGGGAGDLAVDDRLARDDLDVGLAAHRGAALDGLDAEDHVLGAGAAAVDELVPLVADRDGTGVGPPEVPPVGALGHLLDDPGAVGDPPAVVAVRVDVGRPERDDDPVGRVATLRSEKAPTTYQLAGTRQLFDESLSREELSTYLTHDSIFRFDWCSEREQTPSVPDDPLSK
jgi:hypothetical protein